MLLLTYSFRNEINFNNKNTKKNYIKKLLSLQPFKSILKNYLKFVITDLWCNGSTTGFGSVSPGSNPGRSTIRLKN